MLGKCQVFVNLERNIILGNGGFPVMFHLLNRLSFLTFSFLYVKCHFCLNDYRKLSSISMSLIINISEYYMRVNENVI